MMCMRMTCQCHVCGATMYMYVPYVMIDSLNMRLTCSASSRWRSMDRCVLLAGRWKRGRSRLGVLKRPGVAPAARGEPRLGVGLGSGLPMDASVAAYSCRRVACAPYPMSDARLYWY